MAILAQEVRSMLAGGRTIEITSIRRDRNVVNHELVTMGHTSPKTTVWLRSVTEDIVNLCIADQI